MRDGTPKLIFGQGCNMRLSEAIDSYELERDVSAPTVKAYREAVRIFGKWLGHEPTLADLTTERLNRWIRSEQQRGLSTHSIATRRRCLLVVARFAARRGLVSALEGEIRQVRLAPTPKHVWTADEVQRIVDACDKLADTPTPIHGLPRRAWWRSLVMAAWDTALRQADLFGLKFSIVAAQFELVQHKTGVPHWVRLRAETLEAIAAMRTDSRDLIWPLSSRRWFQRGWSELVARAGLAGPFPQLRRSSITDVEGKQRGAGMIQAGHTTPTTTVRWYLPRARMIDTAPMPERLTRMATSEKNEQRTRRFVTGVKVGDRLEIETGGQRLAIAIEKDSHGRGRTRLVVESSATDPPPIIKRQA